MNIVDIIIILLVLMYAVVGLKRGFFKQTLMTIGTILVFVIGFFLKNPVAEFLSLNLPFFDFRGSFTGLSVLNILMYQLIAFILVLALLFVVLNILIKLASGLEKFLNFTIILGIPSKILGFIIGLIEGYVVVFVILFFLSQPAVNLDIVNNSKLKSKILNSTPVLSNVVKDTNKSIKDIYELAKDFEDRTSNDEYNKETIDVMLRNKIIKVEYVDKLIKKDKLNIVGIEPILNKYR